MDRIVNGGKALITGGAGFIGSHLAELLLKRGDAVQVLDDVTTGTVENIAHMRSHPRFSYLMESVTNRTAMEGLVHEADVIYHLAASVGVRLVLQRPIQAIKTNIEGTELVLELAAREGKKVLITSTSEVYGKLDKKQYSEEDGSMLGPTTNGRWSYAASKIVDEFLAMAYYRQKRLPVIIVRLFNTIGPRQKGEYGMVVPRLVRQALLGEPITVYGDGTQRRSFTWVGDVVNAIVALTDHPQAPGQVFNVGHTQDISIYDLAVTIKKLTKSASEIVCVPYDQAYEPGFEDVPHRLPDISRIQRLIGYHPTLDITEMLVHTIAHEEQKLAAGTMQ